MNISVNAHFYKRLIHHFFSLDRSPKVRESKNPRHSVLMWKPPSVPLLYKTATSETDCGLLGFHLNGCVSSHQAARRGKPHSAVLLKFCEEKPERSPYSPMSLLRSERSLSRMPDIELPTKSIFGPSPLH